MRLEIDKRFKQKLKGRVERFQFEVGILNDGPYMVPQKGKRGLKGEDVTSNYAGGPVRKKSRKDSGMTISDISKENRDRLGFNYLSKPFEKRNLDRARFTKAFLQLVFSLNNSKKRVENLFQAVVRNPILRGDYGPNSPLTKKIKGFDRAMIDTAQLFKAIRARVKVVGRV